MQKINLTEAQKAKLSAILQKYTDYATFSQTRIDAYEYTSTLGVRVCPYCNINYTYTVYEIRNNDGLNGEHVSVICRPDLDHFESKSDPESAHLSLAQDNLIPACQQCNSRVKFRKKFSILSHLHPFRDDFDRIKKFSINLHDPNFSVKGSFDITLENRTSNLKDIARADKSIEDLKIIPRYKYHKEEVVRLFQKASYYHRQKLKEIENLTETAGLRRCLFPMEAQKINDSPLAKLRSDILEILRLT